MEGEIDVSNNGDLFVGMMLGGVMGFVAGLMVAPESGEDTRDRLREQARTMAEEFREGAEEFTVKLKDGAEEVMRRSQENLPDPDQLDGKLEQLEQKLRQLEEQLDSSS